MAAAEWWCGQGGTTQTIAAGVTRFVQVAAGFASLALTTESDAERTIRTAGTFSKLALRLSANSLSSTLIARFRKNAGDGNQTFTITSATTGWFEDTSGSDAVSAGDEACVSLVAAAGTGTATVKAWGGMFAAGSNTVALLGSTVALAFAVNSATTYLPFSGTLSSQTTETNAQARTKTAATLKNLQVKVTGNTRGDSTLRTRKNAANGGQSFTITGSTTGVFEDTSNTDTLAVDDLYNAQLVTGGGGGTLTMALVAVEFETTNGSHMWLSGGHAGSALLATDATRYYNAQGDSGSGNATSTENVQRARQGFTASLLQMRVSANTTDDAALVTFRLNNAAGAQQLSVTAATTGWFEDASDSDVVEAGDDVNIEVNPAGTAGTLTWRHLGFLATVASAAALSEDYDLARRAVLGGPEVSVFA